MAMTTMNVEHHRRLHAAYESAKAFVSRNDDLDWETVTNVEYAKGGCMALMEALSFGAVLTDDLVDSWVRFADHSKFLTDEEDN